MRLKPPQKPFLIQKPMLRVCLALAPLQAAAVWLFGWRALALAAVSVLGALAAEAAFAWPRKQPVTSAALVTGLIFALSLPPGLPLGMAILGAAVGIALGKMVFGGFGRNVFNPAMVGRCFIYITFPLHMTGRWPAPLAGGAGGFAAWSAPLDAATRATPLAGLRAGSGPAWENLLLGRTAGSLGETSALLILLGGLYLIFRRTAPWRPAAACLIGSAAAVLLLRLAGAAAIPGLLPTWTAGSFLFGAAFVVTEPVSGPKTRPGQWIYGFLIGALIVLLRGFSNFSEGVMFSVLIFNAFVPLLDQSIQAAKRRAGG
jgi:Na+-transporting NADH:ubiquinone oxidoreductase subunit B